MKPAETGLRRLATRRWPHCWFRRDRKAIGALRRLGGRLLCGSVACLIAVGVFAPVAAQAFAAPRVDHSLYDGDSLDRAGAQVPGSVVPRGPDGNMWFTTSAGRIARVTPSGVVTEFGHGISGGGAVSLVSGSDGALWFSERGVGNDESLLGRITTSGVISEYRSALWSVTSVALGGDGAMWYVGCPSR